MTTLGKNQLTSTSVLQVDVTSKQTMLIISGIAIPELANPNHDNAVYQNDFKIDLGVFALEVLHSSITVGLTDVAEPNSGAEFGFAVGHTSLIVKDTGELTLGVRAQVSGAATLHRFSYQVVALVDPVVSKVSGTVTWDRNIWNEPSGADVPAKVKSNILARLSKLTSSPETLTTTTEIKKGVITKYTRGSTKCVAEFEIESPPLGEVLAVGVRTGDNVTVEAGEAISVVQTSGPSSFTLSTTHSSEVCDFLITTFAGPK